MKNKSAQGFILVMTLLYILLFSLLLLSMMQRFVFDYQLTDHVREGHLSVHLLEERGHQLAARLPDTPVACFIHEPNPTEVSFEWLKAKGCQNVLQDVVYYYVVADLGSYPCLQLEAHGTHHWWVIVMSERHHHHQALWLRIATPEKAVVCSAPSDARIIHREVSWYLESVS